MREMKNSKKTKNKIKQQQQKQKNSGSGLLGMWEVTRWGRRKENHN